MHCGTYLPVSLTYFYKYNFIYKDANVVTLFFEGEILYSHQNSNFSVCWTFCWKPRPASLLKLQIGVSQFIMLFLFGG